MRTRATPWGRIAVWYSVPLSGSHDPPLEGQRFVYLWADGIYSNILGGVG